MCTPPVQHIKLELVPPRKLNVPGKHTANNTRQPGAHSGRLVIKKSDLSQCWKHSWSTGESR
ncbi:hypothetical protein IscW_ISCW015114 [Ixodes scapularis]|uniref:Uncharacterized protein n=1 Tax=Ixodes scapularis TaxID=6945 RepID=B7QNK9_IXOSC|nr:hypothetical protein IscW_ISCW015114 [Ixodes scapularis]|eukprot:XP_002416514.1 hypothetical protein IscW_ISCW015114 [Ixodes scapularis]